MNNLLILIFCLLFQDKNVKEFTLKISKNESIVVQVDIDKNIGVSTSKLGNIIREANEISLVDVRILNKTNKNLTFNIFKSNCFYGEKYIVEDTESVFVGIVCGGKLKKNIIKPNDFISSRIPVPTKYENKKVKSFTYRINYYSSVREWNAITINFIISGTKIEISEILNRSLDK